MSQSHRLVAIMFTDIVGYTRLMGESERRAWQVLKKNKSLHKKYINKYGGKLLKEMGDGILASFDSALNAVYCAGELLAQIRNDPDHRLRIGINLGDVLIEDDDIFGDEVNIASRLQEKAEPGQLLVSGLIYNSIRNKEGIESQKLSEQQLKNVSRPIDIYSVSVSRFPTRKAFYFPSSKLVSYGASMILLFAFIYFAGDALYRSYLRNSIVQSKVDVFPFENHTGLQELESIGTTAMQQIRLALENCCPDVQVVSHRTYLRSQIIPIGNYREATGAEIVIKGSYDLENDSTIMFKAFIENTENNKKVDELAKSVRAHIEAPEKGIEEISHRVVGYWRIKDKPLLQGAIPIPQAVDEYYTAIEQWLDNTLALYHINRAIALDSSFYSAYFLKAALQRNMRDFDNEAITIAFLDSKRAELSSPLRLQLNFYKSDLKGERFKAYSQFKQLYERDTKDWFNNSSMSTYALLYANKPKEAIEILNKIPEYDSDCDLQSYCIERISTRILSLIKTMQYPQTDQYLDKLSSIDRNRYYKLKIRNWARSNMSDDSRELAINRLLSNPEDIRVVMLYLYITRELYTAQRDDLLKKYIEMFYQNEGKTFKNHPSISVQIEIINKDYTRALQSLEEMETLSNLMNRKKAIALAKLGRTEELNLLKQSMDRSSEKYDYGSTEYVFAVIETALGNYNDAVILLQESLQKGMRYTLDRFQYDVDLRELSDHPGFIKLVAAKG